MPSPPVKYLARIPVGLSGLLGACTMEPPPAPCQLSPILIEEFNELSVSPSTIGPARWISHTPWSGDFGDAVFVDDGPDGPFSIHDGILHITARKDASGRWTSGLLAAADATGNGKGVQNGYFEARMKLPPGPGTWPAFWLAALKPVAERDGNVEIDVLEYYGQFTSAFRSAVHIWFADPARKRANGTKVDIPDGFLVQDYHVFGLDISETDIVFLLDGKEFWREPRPPELDVPMYPLVNLALGSGWPIDETPNPSVMQVDYVYVWERTHIPPEGCSPGPPSD